MADDIRIFNVEADAVVKINPKLLVDNVSIDIISKLDNYRFISDHIIINTINRQNTEIEVYDVSSELAVKELEVISEVYDTYLESAYKIPTNINAYDVYLEVATIKAPLYARTTQETLEVLVDANYANARSSNNNLEILVEKPHNNSNISFDSVEIITPSVFSDSRISNNSLELIISNPISNITNISNEIIINFPVLANITSLSTETIVKFPTSINLTYDCLEVVASVNSMISGKVFDNYGFPLQKLLRLYKQSDDSLIASTVSDGYGNYEFIVDRNTLYYIIAGNPNDEELEVKYSILSV